MNNDAGCAAVIILALIIIVAMYSAYVVHDSWNDHMLEIGLKDYDSKTGYLKWTDEYFKLKEKYKETSDTSSNIER